jgi:iron(III) transport system permease protein
METLTDIGTVRLFNVSTLADGVMRVWFGTGNLGAATELASALTGAAILLIACERLLHRRGRSARGTSEGVMVPRSLSPVAVSGVLATVVAVLVVAVGIPIARLIDWSVESMQAGQAVTVAGGVWHHVGSTLSLVVVSTVVSIVIGTLLALLVAHKGGVARLAGRVSTIGYAMPGPVVAVGAVVMLAALDRRGVLPSGFFLVGSTIGLVYALLVRFLAVGYQGVEASLERISTSAVESARVLGAGSFRTALSVEIPAARFGILAATALLAVDISKELPITLLLRPFGVDTLSVWVWQSTSESLWAQAAVPALLMVFIGMIAVGLLLVALERGAELVS